MLTFFFFCFINSHVHPTRPSRVRPHYCSSSSFSSYSTTSSSHDDHSRQATFTELIGTRRPHSCCCCHENCASDCVFSWRRRAHDVYDFYDLLHSFIVHRGQRFAFFFRPTEEPLLGNFFEISRCFVCTFRIDVQKTRQIVTLFASYMFRKF